MDMQPVPSPAPASPDANRFPLPYLLAVLAAMAALLWTLTAEDPWGWLMPRYVEVEIQAQVYRVPERELERLSRTRPAWLDQAEAEALERLSLGVSRELDLLFERVHRRVPEFADWYYSVPGVTLRLLAAVPNPFWSARGDFMTEVVTERLFPEPAWREELAALDRAVAALHSRELATLEAGWLAWLARELAPYRQDGPAAAGEPIDVQQRLRDHVAGLLEADRIGVQMTAGAGAGALLARAAITRVNAAAASARAAARLAGRGTAGASTAACGFTGPLAIGCGVVVFVGGILGTEWALLKADEALNRDDLERALHASVDALRETMEAEYARPFLALFESDVNILAEGVQASLRPVDRLRGAGAPR